MVEKDEILYVTGVDLGVNKQTRRDVKWFIKI